MNAPFSVIIPFASSTVAAALDLASQTSAPVILSGEGTLPGSLPRNVSVISSGALKGDSIRAALATVQTPITLLQDPDPAYRQVQHQHLASPISRDEADVVFGAHASRGSPLSGLPDRALGSLAQWVTQTDVSSLLSGVRAFRTDALKGLALKSSDDAIDAEIVVKLAAQMCRFLEVQIPLVQAPVHTLRAQLIRARSLLRYATTQNDTDNQHEGYNTLARMETAPRYNAWVGQKIKPHLGSRVLEVGAGIGTITEQIEPGRELVIALEVDAFYVERLKNRFRGKPNVRPYLSGVELADWERLAQENIDSIVLSNVLEHIEDDVGAVRNFLRAVKPGGVLIVLVPALPSLFGSMDDAVGHFRRYTPATLRHALEAGGFVVEALEWMNLVGIPGWFMNSRIFKKRAVPPFQLRAYDALAPTLAQIESRVSLPVGMSLFAVARAPLR